MTPEKKQQLKEKEKEALAIIEKHMEAAAVELVPVAQSLGDIALADSSPLVKILYGTGAPQIASVLKSFIPKLDLDGDGQ